MNCSSFRWLFVSQNGFHSTSQIALSLRSFIAHIIGKIADHLMSSNSSEEFTKLFKKQRIFKEFFYAVMARLKSIDYEYF